MASTRTAPRRRNNKSIFCMVRSNLVRGITKENQYIEAN